MAKLWWQWDLHLFLLSIIHQLKLENLKFHKKCFTLVNNPKRSCVPSRIAYNHTLKGGRTAGEYRKLGPSSSIQECIDQCCQSELCDVAFFLNRYCYGVQCYTAELCQTIAVEEQFTKDFTPTISYMNKREGKRLKHKGAYRVEARSPHCRISYRESLGTSP